MTELKHTEGEWFTSIDFYDPYGCQEIEITAVQENGGSFIATVTSGGQEGIADAILIAAAPTLLAVCKKVVANLRPASRGRVGIDADLVPELHAAIALATCYEVEDGHEP